MGRTDKKPAADRVGTRPRESWWAYAYLAAVLFLVVGFLGAAAFNPDNGSLLRNETLWTAFGLAAYLGLAVILLLVLIATGRLALRLARRIRQSQESAL